MRGLSPYLVFDGTCAAAFDFYTQVLGAECTGRFTVGEGPMADKVPPGNADRIMHAGLRINGQTLMGCDAMPGQPVTPMGGFSLSLGYDTVEECRRVFDALSEGGQVTMPLAETFWSPAFGMVVDKFGVPWMVNCHTEGH